MSANNYHFLIVEKFDCLCEYLEYDSYTIQYLDIIALQNPTFSIQRPTIASEENTSYPNYYVRAVCVDSELTGGTTCSDSLTITSFEVTIVDS